MSLISRLFGIGVKKSVRILGAGESVPMKAFKTGRIKAGCSEGFMHSSPSIDEFVKEGKVIGDNVIIPKDDLPGGLPYRVITLQRNTGAVESRAFDGFHGHKMFGEVLEKDGTKTIYGTVGSEDCVYECKTLTNGKRLFKSPNGDVVELKPDQECFLSNAENLTEFANSSKI